MTASVFTIWQPRFESDILANTVYALAANICMLLLNNSLTAVILTANVYTPSVNVYTDVGIDRFVVVVVVVGIVVVVMGPFAGFVSSFWLRLPKQAWIECNGGHVLSR